MVMKPKKSFRINVFKRIMVTIATVGSAVVEHSTHQLKVEGLIPVSPANNRGEKI